jgi:hypothetical protein
VDEAKYVSGGSRNGYWAHEVFLDGGHDPWIDIASDQYQEFLVLRRDSRISSPLLSDAPWRR